MRCKDCKNYTPDTEYKDIGKCKSEKFVYNGGGKGGKPIPIDGLGYYDNEDYAAGFDVGKNFGCIHFEPKYEGIE